MKIKAKDRFGIAAMGLDDLARYIGSQTLPSIGQNSRLLLTEVGLRLNTPADAVAILVHRKQKDMNQLYLWTTYDAAKLEAVRAEGGRKWNDTVKANTFMVDDDDVDRVVDFTKKHYAKVLLVNAGSHRIENGSANPVWSERPLYELLDHPVTVNLMNAVQGLTSLRPHDHAQRIGLHGEVDLNYRTLFGAGLKVDENMAALEIKTRHPFVLFRMPVPNGQLRYLKYSTEQACPVEVYFGDKEPTRRILSLFKETQERLKHPIVEKDDALLLRLRLMQRWPDPSP